MEEYIGIIRIFAGNFAPYGWVMCQGQLLNIQEYVAVYSILGTTYGGDGKTTFGVPDLRGRMPVGMGEGTGLTALAWGETGGEETALVTLGNMPIHNHPFVGSVSWNVNDASAILQSPVDAYLAQPTTSAYLDSTSGQYAGNLNVNLSVGMAGGINGAAQSFPLLPPHLGVNFVMCVLGDFPTRD